MKRTAIKFANGSLNGYLNGCIGAIDGWLVNIKCPSKTKDGINNPGSFYSCKGCYVFNVQIIADKNRRVLWTSILFRGAEHDSTAFLNTKLYEQLHEKI